MTKFIAALCLLILGLDVYSALHGALFMAEMLLCLALICSQAHIEGLQYFEDAE